MENSISMVDNLLDIFINIKCTIIYQKKTDTFVAINNRYKFVINNTHKWLIIVHNSISIFVEFSNVLVQSINNIKQIVCKNIKDYCGNIVKDEYVLDIYD